MECLLRLWSTNCQTMSNHVPQQTCPGDFDGEKLVLAARSGVRATVACSVLMHLLARRAQPLAKGVYS